jgi:uncharacterized protein (DUF433 family)
MKLTGVGLYTFHEAARLTRIPLRDLRRWLGGYTYRDKRNETSIAVPPLWDRIAARWYPEPKNKAIVLDPRVAFGKPIVTDGGVRTSILHDAFVTEADKSFVAKLYEVPVSAVDAAITFEERLAAA